MHYCLHTFLALPKTDHRSYTQRNVQRTINRPPTTNQLIYLNTVCLTLSRPDKDACYFFRNQTNSTRVDKKDNTHSSPNYDTIRYIPYNYRVSIFVLNVKFIIKRIHVKQRAHIAVGIAIR